MNSHIRLNMCPATPPLTWKEFCASAPPYSIALDGYVSGGPQFDPEGPRVSLNHHEDVDRLATRATCAQVHVAVRQGLFTCFRDEHGARAEVYANDSDQDVCLSWYLLKNHYRAEPVMNAALNRLVGMEDMLDATAGACPYPVDMPVLHELAWVFDPYTRARATDVLDARDASVFTGVVDDVRGRIDRHLVGAGDALALDTRYERVDVPGSGGLTVVREIGSHARTGMFADGIRAFLSVRQRASGRWSYVLGRMSRFVPLDVPRFLDGLNEVEGLLGSADRWGGGDTVGGSPRIAGSVLCPKDVVALATRYMTIGRTIERRAA